MSRHDRTGERLEDEQPAGADLCRIALAAANAARRCPHCGGQLRPGWTAHPSCTPKDAS